MYLRGLSGMGLLVEDAAGNVYDDGQDASGPQSSGGYDQGGMPSSSDTGPTAQGDWINLAGKVLTTWGNLAVAKVQTSGDVAKAQASARYQVPAAYRVQQSPGAIGGVSTGTLLALGLVGAAAWIALK